MTSLHGGITCIILNILHKYVTNYAIISLFILQNISGVLTLIAFLAVECMVIFISATEECVSPAISTDFTKPFSILTDESMAVVDPAYRHTVVEGNVTTTNILVEPRGGSAFVEHRLRAICPWTYVENVDNERIPSTIVEAKCIRRRCRGCSSHYYHDSQLRRPACSEVYYYASVMRKTGCDENGRSQYETALQRISVGCTCLRVAGSRPLVQSNGYPESPRSNN